jgi:purine-binding chemotaxis protein CheW
MAEPGQTDGGTRRFLTFRRDASRYALPAEEVAEVIRVPVVVRLPLSPHGLLGVANLRGAVLPVASLGALLGLDANGTAVASRAIVLLGDAPVALVVDAVDALVSVDAEQVETAQGMMAAEPGERLRGAFRTGSDQPVTKILDIQALLASAFVQRAHSAVHARSVGQTDGRPEAADETADAGKLVTFEIAGQEYALPLDTVREIIPIPDASVLVPHSEALLLGVVGYRDTLLPLFSLRGLLGFPPAPDGTASGKIVVSVVGGVLVGLVADRMRAIVPADPALIEATPAILATRTGGEARITAIYRGEAGKRLISILAPDVLFREEIMGQLGHTRGAVDADDAAQPAETGEVRTFLVFRLGDDEFGVPIAMVDEVAQVPAHITRVPRTPDFLEGVVNLRGEVLPVVDQRRRFGMPPLDDGSRRRLVVVRTAQHRAGLIVDSVSEVLRSDAGLIAEAPDLTGEATRLVNGVINLEQAGRMILVLDPAELLTRAERGLLDAFDAGAVEQSSP